MEFESYDLLLIEHQEGANPIPDSIFMKTTFRVIVLLFVCALIACALYPLIEYLWRDVLNILDDPAARIFRRVWQITILVGLIVDRKGLGLRNPLKVGFEPSWNRFKEFILGMGVAWVYLGLLTVTYIWFEFWAIRNTIDPNYVAKKYWQGFYQGMLVALLEEYIFRGLIFFSLAARWGWIRAAVLCSLIFSSLHFLEGRGMETLDPQSWWAGFLICGKLLTNMAKEFTLFPDAVGLFLVGMILCYAAQKTGNLWYAVGLHGGWVFYSKFIWSLVVNKEILSEYFIGGGRLFNGVIPMITMLLIFPVTWGLSKIKWLKNENNAK